MDNLAEILPEQRRATADLTLVVKQDSVGQQLKKARQTRGWSAAQVAQRLKLSQRYIAAIEADDFVLLPSAIFVRGYLRNYAKCVGLESDAIVAAYERHMSANSEPLKLHKRERVKAFPSAPIMRALGALSVLLFVLSSMYWWRSEQPVVTLVREQVAVVEVDTVAGETKVQTLDLNAPDVTDSVLRAAEMPVGTATPGVTIAGPGDVVEVEFIDSSWLEVRDSSGQLLFSGVKSAGEKLQLFSLTRFDIAIGNAAAVKLSYNSAPVDLTTYRQNGNAVKLMLGM